VDQQGAKKRFGARMQALRSERGWTQEKLAEALQKSTEHISFLERGERSPSFETLLDIAVTLDTTVADLLDETIVSGNALIETLGVAPVVAPLPEPAHHTPSTEPQRMSDLERLNSAMMGIREMQRLADKYGISDVLQDNGGKVLQVLIILQLKMLPGREGNDAVDDAGNEYELKTVNLALNARAGITTHHHLNNDILQKYRKVYGWYIAIYDGIELREIFLVSPLQLSDLFSTWEQKIKSGGQALNNPKIPLKLVRSSQRVFPAH
jgi:DNA-binding XRE family transcriptional regulator